MADKKKTKANRHTKIAKSSPGFNRYRPELSRGEVPLTERELLSVLNEETNAAYKAVRDITRRFGEQKVYNSARAIMFARRVCFMFVRPKKSHLELSFFLPKNVNHSTIQRSRPVSQEKYSHTVKLLHRNQVDARLAGWLKEAYAYSN